jgi:hypothetical protein
MPILFLTTSLNPAVPFIYGLAPASHQPRNSLDAVEGSIYAQLKSGRGGGRVSASNVGKYLRRGRGSGHNLFIFLFFMEERVEVLQIS